MCFVLAQPWFQIQCAGGEIVIDGSFDGGITVYDREHPTGWVPAGPEGWGTSYVRQMEAFLSQVFPECIETCSQAIGFVD